MRKLLVWIACFAIVTAFGLSVGTDHAMAIPAFKKEFDAKYVKKDGTDVEKAFAAKVEKVKCNVCHKGQKKKDRNAYGEALAELLDKKADEKDVAKIKMALDEVAKKHSKADDDTSPTFGELIEKGELPGGNE